MKLNIQVEKIDINHTSMETYKNSIIYKFTCHKGEVHDDNRGIGPSEVGQEGFPEKETLGLRLQYEQKCGREWSERMLLKGCSTSLGKR